MVYYVCKYTPVELFAGFGAETAVLDGMFIASYQPRQRFPLLR